MNFLLKKILGKKIDELSKDKGSLIKSIIKRRIIKWIILFALVVVLGAAVFSIGVYVFFLLSAGASQVTTSIIDEVDLSDDSELIPPSGADCTCGNCVPLTNNSPSYTTGNLGNSTYDSEVVKLVTALANDTGSFAWMPYAKSAVEYSSALMYQSHIYTNFSSIYTNYTDLLNSPDKWGSIGLLQITEDNANAQTYSKSLINNKASFNSVVASVGGNLNNYTTIVDPKAVTLYDDRLYLPAQLGTDFYYYKEAKSSMIKQLKEYIPGYDSLNADVKEVVNVLLYLACWNNGTGGTKTGLKNSKNGQLGQYLVDLATMYCTDAGFETLINIDGVDYGGGNNYTKVVKGVVQLMGKNVGDYINSEEVNGGDNDRTSRVYCYCTNGLLKGSKDFKKVIENTGGTVTGTLGRLSGNYTSVTAGFDNIKLNYTEKSVDGLIEKEYETVYGPLDYTVDLLEIGSDYADGGTSDVPDRKLKGINGIVIHYTGGGTNGTAAGVRSWFDQPYEWQTDSGTYTSSHYAIGAEGEIIQMIPLDNESIASNGANSDTISIEVNYTDADGAYGSKAYNSLLHLVAWLCVEFNISTDTEFIKSDNSSGDTFYRDMGQIQRHYDVSTSSDTLTQRAKACPLYWVPNDGSAQESGTTDGGNARWIAFKKDVTDFILTYRYEPDFRPSVEVPGLEEAKLLPKETTLTNWGNGTPTNSGSVQWGCSCGIPCPKCNCHNDSVTGGSGYKGDLTGRANTSDYGYGSFNGDTWASSQFLNNAKTIMRAMIVSGFDYQETEYDPIGGFFAMRYDCSGYVSAVLHYSGYTDFKKQTSRDFDDDFASKYGWTKITSMKDLKAGDIMVMNGGDRDTWGTDQIGHVQIYAGDYRIYNCGSGADSAYGSYLTKYDSEVNPYSCKSSWTTDVEKRFIFGWRPTRPN